MEVKSFEVSDIRSGTSTSARLRVEYNGAGRTAILPERVYIKGGFQEDMRRRVWAGLAIEAKFFSQFAPALSINIPRCYFAAIDEDSRQAIVILEDLAVRNVTFGHATHSLRADTVAEFLELLAQMHAQWWQSPGLTDIADWAAPQRVYLKYLLRTKYWNEVLKRPYGSIPFFEAIFSTKAETSSSR